MAQGKKEKATLSPQEMLAQDFFAEMSDPAVRKRIVKSIIDATEAGNASAQKTLLSLFGKLEDFHRNSKDQILVKIVDYHGKVPSNICPHCGQNTTEKPPPVEMKEVEKEATDAA